MKGTTGDIIGSKAGQKLNGGNMLKGIKGATKGKLDRSKGVC